MSARRHAPPSGLLTGLLTNGRALGTTLPLLAVLLAPANARAQTGAETVAAGAAVAGVVLEAIGGLATWIGNQSDDCAAAALGAAWGKDCNLSKKECTDTGYWSAYCSETADNACAHGFGQALAQEGAFGSWSGCTTSPYASAWTKSLHTTGDSHAGRGWGKAAVDGTSRAEEDATPDASPGLHDLGSPPLSPLAGGWPNGTILARVSVDTVSLSAGGPGVSSARFQSTVRINGAEIWSGSVSLDGTGAVTLGGGLGGAAPTTWFDPVSNQWQLRLYGVQYEHYVGTFGDGAALQTATDVAVSMESEVEADAANANDGGTPTYSTVDPTMIHLNDAYGEPLLKGQYIQVASPFVVTSPPGRFGTVMTDLHLWNPQTNRGLGVLDFAHLPPFPPGQQVMVRGCLTHHDGRTVLVDTELVPMGIMSLPPVTMMPLQQFNLNAEEFENRRVTIVEQLQFAGNESVSSGDIVTWIVPGMGLSVDTYLDPDAGPWPTIQPGTLAQVSGYVLQEDPEQAGGHGERGMLAPRASDGQPGYHGGYVLRPESAADLMLSTAGVGDDRAGLLPSRPFALAQNHPNPFVPATTIVFRLDENRPVRLEVVDVAGRRVRTLMSGAPGIGTHSIEWDGRDEAGRPVAGGLYLYTLEAGADRETKKMILAR